MTPSRRDFLRLAGGGAAACAVGVTDGSAEAATTGTPFRFVGRYAVVRGLAGNSRKLVTAPRAGGGYIALWEQSPDFNNDFSYYRLFDNAGTPVGANTQVSSDTLADDRIGSVVSHPDGTSNVFSFGLAPNDASGALWWMQRVAANGARLGPRVKIASGTGGDDHWSARLADGRIVCAGHDQDAPGNFAKVVTPTGAVLAETTESLFHNWIEGMAALPRSAGVALAHYRSPFEIAFHVFDASLQRAAEPLVFPATQAYAGVAVAPHPKGVVAIWTAAGANGVDDPFIDGAVISSAGTLVQRLQPIRLKPGLDMNNGHDLYPALLTLPDGRILLARNKRALDARGRDVFSIVVHLWGTDGRFAANPVTVYRDTAAIGELFVRINHPRSMIRLSNRTVLLTYDTGPWGGPHVAQAVAFRVA